MAKHTIYNIDTLDKEVYRLKLKALRMEQQLEKKGRYLRSNALVLLLSAFFPKRKSGESSFLSIGSLLMRNEKVQEGLAKATDAAADKLSEAVEKLLQYLKRRQSPDEDKQGLPSDI